MSNIQEVENEINHMAAEIIANKLGSGASLSVTPFTIKCLPQKGHGLGGYINQSSQLHDFESWVSPGNYVLHILDQN